MRCLDSMIQYLIQKRKTDKAHTKLMELLDMCEQLGIIRGIDEDMLDKIESEDF